MPDLTASGLMDERVTTLSPDTEIHDAMQTLLGRNISGAPVIDGENRVVGMLSERDCLKMVTASAFERLPEGKVRDYMTKDVVTIAPSATIYEIVDLYLKTAFQRIPVVEDNTLVGVVSRTSVVKAIASMRDNPELYRDPEHELEDEGAGVDSAMRRARGQ